MTFYCETTGLSIWFKCPQSMKPDALRDISSHWGCCDAGCYRRHRATDLFVPGLDAAPSRASAPAYRAHLEAVTPFAAASQFVLDSGQPEAERGWARR